MMHTNSLISLPLHDCEIGSVDELERTEGWREVGSRTLKTTVEHVKLGKGLLTLRHEHTEEGEVSCSAQLSLADGRAFTCSAGGLEAVLGALRQTLRSVEPRLPA